MTNNFDKVFILFKKNYVQVPLEVFEKDAYKTLISTLLSSRTNDQITHTASFRLFKKAANVNALKNLKTNELKNLIYPVGFYKTKAKHLTNLAEIIIRDFSGEVPQTREELMTLPGVGRKTANLVLNRAFGIPAIAVDTHVHRISNMLGWVSTNTPEQTESELVKILPRKYWRDINRLFVSIGRQFTSKKKLDRFLRSNKLV